MVSLKKIGLQEDLTAAYREVIRKAEQSFAVGHGRDQETVVVH